MREGWEYKTFGEVGTFLRGKSIQKADFVEHGLPCIHYGQIHTKFGVSVNKHLSEIPEEIYNKSIIASPGDIVIAITSEDLEGSCKSTAWLGDYDVAVSSHAAVYKHNLNSKFIAYYFRSNSFYIEKEKYARGFKVMEIKPTDIARIPIPVPSEKIQSRVVSELDKINELIRLKKEQLKDYDNLAQSIFYEMFGDPVVNEKGWEVKKLGEVSMIKTGPFGSMLHKEDYITGGIPLINPMHIQNFKAVPDKDFSISKEKAAELCNYQLKINDIIFARRGDIGRCAVISDKEAGCLCGTGSLFVRFERKLSSIYTMYVVRTTSFIKELVSKAKGATMLNLNSSTMENLRFPIPPLPLQQLFAQRIELIEQQKDEIKSTIADLKTLLASRMQYWFD